MDVKFMKKLMWFGERTVRRHPGDKQLADFVAGQNARIYDSIREYLAQNPDKNESFNPEVDIMNYARLEGIVKKEKKNDIRKNARPSKKR